MVIYDGIFRLQAWQINTGLRMQKAGAIITNPKVALGDTMSLEKMQIIMILKRQQISLNTAIIFICCHY